MRMLVKDTRSQDGKDDKDNDKGSKSRSQSMKEQAYNKEQRERPRPHELNDKSNLIDLMKESLAVIPVRQQIATTTSSGSSSPVSLKTHIGDDNIKSGAAVVHYGVVSCFIAKLLTIEYTNLAKAGRKIPESLIPIGKGDGVVKRFPDGDGDGDGDEVKKRGCG
ncbi:hypothetical protein Tco_1033361 [Tanacetum coccineum]